MSTHGWRVVRILRITIDDTVHPTYQAAQQARDWLRHEYPDQELALAHTSLPLDAVMPPDPETERPLCAATYRDLTCDKPAGHEEIIHHDPGRDMPWGDLRRREAT